MKTKILTICLLLFVISTNAAETDIDKDLEKLLQIIPKEGGLDGKFLICKKNIFDNRDSFTWERGFSFHNFREKQVIVNDKGQLLEVKTKDTRYRTTLTHVYLHDEYFSLDRKTLQLYWGSGMQYGSGNKPNIYYTKYEPCMKCEVFLYKQNYDEALRKIISDKKRIHEEKIKKIIRENKI